MISRRKYLQELCNKYGDFAVAMSFMKDDEVIWSKHRSVLELWHSDWGLGFLERVNHRQILPVEIILDKDSKNNLLWLEDTCVSLNEEGRRFKAYSTGSRGHHIHIFDIALGMLNRNERQEKRLEIIGRYDAESQKASDGCMIAIENVPHWKSGKLKELVMENA